MDRRQRKTREAIFSAFTELLSKKDFNQITVGEIINAAVGICILFHCYVEHRFDFFHKIKVNRQQ